MPASRPSLMGLKKPLVSAKGAATAGELEKNIVGGSEPAAPIAAAGAAAALEKTVLGPRTRLTPKAVKAKVATSLLAVRVPLELHERLRAVAAHNRVNMSDIVVEAIEGHLEAFPQPG